MEAKLEAFYRRLKQGPTVLFLGQSYLGLEKGTDAFLSEVLRKYGSATGDKSHYYQVLGTQAANSVESALAWMDERCRRLSVPEWVKLVANYAWSCIYTSAIDSIWPGHFRTSWRDIQPILDERYKPNDPRNRFVLHCTFLFGCVNRTEETERPPLSRFDWLKRKQTAIGLARRLPELITPKGTLVIEGYAGDDDWFSVDDLLPILDFLAPRQIQVFSATEGFLQHPFVKLFLQREKLVAHQESLAAALARAEALGLLQMGRPGNNEEEAQRISLERAVLVVPREIWNQVGRSAVIVDDSVLSDPPPLSEDARYREFRSFLSSSEGQPRWSGYARGFAFQRDFEKTLRQLVDSRLAAKRLVDEPVILHGQTCTGKTVALGALAYAIRAERKYSVLFIERRTQKPLPSDIDAFCQWAEDKGSPACLVVWDGMVSQEEYSDFLRYLTSRGRKVVLIGSCYRIEDKNANEPRFILAPPQLSQSELERLAAFLKSFHPALAALVSGDRIPVDETFLAALYRLLPPTRGSIRSGVVREVGYAEKLLSGKAAAGGIAPVITTTALGHALLEAGLIAPEQFFPTGVTEIEGEKFDAVQQLTGLVMVPGRLGLSVPLELLLRTLGKEAYSNFAQMLEGVDIFRWFEDERGNIEVGPRNALEARLLVQSRMGAAQVEIGLARRLLLEVREEGSAVLDGREVRFAVDLVRAMGAQSRERPYFSPYFKDLSAALRQLRQERAVENPRLMLQEANLLREWVIDQAKRGLAAATVDEALSEGKAVLDKAINLAGTERKNSPLRSFLLVELAATLGAKTRQMLTRSDGGGEAIKLYEGMRKALLEARVQNPASYHPIDVLAWTTMHLVKSELLDRGYAAEVVADVLHAFQTVDPQDLDPVQLEKFNSRRLEWGEFLDIQELADEAFDALVAAGSAAGYYLRALKISGLPASASNLATGDAESLRRAIIYLEEHGERVYRDTRCLDLLLDLWWMVHTRTRFFEHERAALPLSDADWRKCLEIILALEGIGKTQRPLLLAFIRGLCLFHVGDVGSSVDVFKEVERESEQVKGRRRIVRSYLASTSSGSPRKFHGTVTWVSENGFRGGVYVEELRRQVVFIPRDFGKPDISKGASLGEFHIAFNFLGPIADPPGYYESKR